MRLRERCGIEFWDAATLILISVLLMAHIFFSAIDVRMPHDFGRYYLDIPSMFWQMDGVTETLRVMLESFFTSNGWYQFILAFSMRVFGRNPLFFQLFSFIWYATILISVALVARRMAGPAAGLGAVALTSAFPMVSTMARTPWLHIPEAALLLVMLAILIYDLRLERKGSAIGLACLGALLLLMRASALVWVSSFAACLWLINRDQGLPKMRFRVILVVWGITLLPALARMIPYILAKLDARSRYVVQVSSLAEQLSSNLGLIAATIALLGTLVFLIKVRRSSPPSLLIISWVGIPLLLFLIFHAGMDNFTIFGPAFAIAAAVGLVRLNRYAVAGCLLALASTLMAQWGPQPEIQSWRWLLPGLATHSGITNFSRPFAAFGGKQVAELIDATCPLDGWRTCHIVTNMGLFLPGSEEYGVLELFLMANDRVELRTIHDTPREGWPEYRVDALATFRCGDKEEDWLRKYPDALSTTLAIVQSLDLRPIWGTRVGATCSFHWLTRDKAISDPEALPEMLWPAGFRPWTVQEVQATAQRSIAENSSNNRMLPKSSVWCEHYRPIPEPPDGFSLTAAVEQRRKVIQSLEPYRARWLTPILGTNLYGGMDSDVSLEKGRPRSGKPSMGPPGARGADFFIPMDDSAPHDPKDPQPFRHDPQEMNKPRTNQPDPKASAGPGNTMRLPAFPHPEDPSP